jgi:hypothetical protein
MNGLLHRLAARAMGNAVSVRSNARLPYGGGAPIWADTAASEFGEAPKHPAPRPRMPQPGQIGPELPPRTAVQAAWATGPGEASPAMASRVEHDPIDEPTPGIRALPEQPPGKAVQTAWSTSSGEVPAGMASRIARESIDEPAPGVAAFSEQPLLVRTEAPLATRSEPSTGHGHRPSVAWVPTELNLLMPPAADRSAFAPPMRSAMGATPQLARWSQAGADVSEEAAEVHIHIGRIDVTAVHAAPPPRRRQASTQAPMSLDTYLARRSRS